MTSENEFFYNLEILWENHSSCSMLKLFPKCVNFENVSKNCIRVLGLLNTKQSNSKFFRVFILWCFFDLLKLTSKYWDVFWFGILFFLFIGRYTTYFQILLTTVATNLTKPQITSNWEYLAKYVVLPTGCMSKLDSHLPNKLVLFALMKVP